VLNQQALLIINTPMNIADQIQFVRLNIEQYAQESQHQSSLIRLLAVSKTHPASSIQQAFDSGVTEFGESYLQEALEKIIELRELPIVWHFIGPLQSNKTKLVAENFDWVQSVDREKILIRLNQQRPVKLPPLQVCLQANLFEEAQKQGADLNLLPHLLAITAELPNINLRGLMVIPPKQSNYQRQLEQFQQVADIYSQLKQKHDINNTMDTLSMGMSGDMRAAINCGSNMVRVGTGIFGERKVKPNG